MPKNSTSSFKLIYKIVEQIPRGKVTTYGAIAKAIQLNNSRIVGFALHQNKDPLNIPCHRVVNRYGKLASGYAFGGPGKQSQILLSEGIKIVKNQVELNKYYWDPSNK